jgi:hypothetical protein
MYRKFAPIKPDEQVAVWEQRFCPNDWCDLDTVYVRRHEILPETWHVTEDIEHSGWLVAATGPVCPHCGGNLLTAANVLEGVDGVEKYATH